MASDLKSGDSPPSWLEEFKALYRNARLRHSISRYVLSRGGTPENVRDLLQDTFVVLFQHLEAGSFRGDSSLYTYCLGIAKQLWFNFQRGARDPLPLGAFPGEPVPEESHLSERDALRIEVMKHVLETRLDASTRELLTLYSLGLSFREIAEQQGAASPDAVKQKIYRCLERLLRLLQTHPDLKR
jgi:RNA polymerase sigma factor (sigma-70 family)